MGKPNILTTFDSMKDANCGYFSFGKGLGDAIIRQNKGRFNLNYYLFNQSAYSFDKKVNVVYLSRLHRIFFPGYNKFDVVHFTDQTCRLRPNKVNAKKILTIHDINKVHIKQSKPHRIKAHINKIKKLISECDKVVTISKFVEQDILHYIPEARDKISVIYNGADKLLVPDNYTPTHLPKRPFLFTIGLMSVQKGFHFLPNLLANNDFELVISGIETPHKKVIIEEAKRFGCEDRLIITGPISDDDKAWYYKNCMAFVFPSRAEGFGLPVIEAMHFGKPVFLSKFTSLPEVGGDVAYYFDNFEPEHMQGVFAEGMKDFRARNREKETMLHAGKFTWDNTADQYLKLYEECLRG
ncbi:glycosyltransferase family 4 protein [Mucilaginibacter flavidus]|uniref:glycosyltransferase family 4 protein n=1 Tax=Mucilaginibacter flavidus TaxID=2949309 RepID=UPI002093BBE8|nr:glycosyltransferase family 1 protein [Mucilaginibacter flavidus]MCO5945387.1 glycosyltransferase family 4 protein [Mucilaginibacter flavidus]